MAFDPSKYVLYLEQWRVLICLHENCKFGLTPDGIGLHLRRHHKDIYDLSLRRNIQLYAKTLLLLAPFEVISPTNVPYPIQGLKIWSGWRCRVCFVVGPESGGAEPHCRAKHGWRNWQSINCSK